MNTLILLAALISAPVSRDFELNQRPIVAGIQLALPESQDELWGTMDGVVIEHEVGKARIVLEYDGEFKIIVKFDGRLKIKMTTPKGTVILECKEVISIDHENEVITWEIEAAENDLFNKFAIRMKFKNQEGKSKVKLDFWMDVKNMNPRWSSLFKRVQSFKLEKTIKRIINGDEDPHQESRTNQRNQEELQTGSTMPGFRRTLCCGWNHHVTSQQLVR